MAGKTETKSQYEKFKSAARELGTDESEEAFARVVRKIATAPVTKPDAKPPKKSRATR